MLLKDLIQYGERTVSRLYPQGEAREAVFIILEHLLGTKKYTHIVDPLYEVCAEAIPSVYDAFERVASGEPVQYVLGQAWFCGRCFNVCSDVLIPRPETELLCRTASEKISEAGLQHPRILDLCTGSGCIAWTMALDHPQAEVWAADISQGALRTAVSQDFHEEMGVTGAGRPHFFEADVLGESLFGDGNKPQFDVILSNPPYVRESEKALMRTNVLEHEPSLALFVPDEDPLRFYKAIARHCSSLLADSGFALVEINEALSAETALAFSAEGLANVSVMQDFTGRDRYVLLCRQ